MIMAKRFLKLNCNVHICKRVAEICGFNDYSSLLPHLSFKKTGEITHVGLALPINVLNEKFEHCNFESILNMKTDAVIQKINKTSEDDILFNLKIETVMNSVFGSHLDTLLSEEIPVDRKTVVVDFSSPNIAKPFHFGHLRSTIVGNYVANMLDLEFTVKRLNYLGDWGTQIGYVKIGLDSLCATDIALLENPMREMYKAYTAACSDKNSHLKAKEVFANLEKGISSDWQDEWAKICAITIDHLQKTYSSFGIVFDEYSCESKYRSSNLSSVIQLMEKNNLTSFENNCLIMDMDGEKIPLFKSDGSSLYLIRDIAAALDRLKTYGCENIFYVVDKSQSDHLNKLRYAISKLTYKDVVTHVPFGRIKGMSTRKGTSVFLDDILNETIEKMAEQQQKSPNTRTSDQEVTKILGISALIVYILRQRRNRDFSFSWENALQGTGDTGIKLQYTHSRLCSLEEKCNVSLPEVVDVSVLKEPIIFDLVFELARFPEVLHSSKEHMESSFLVLYLFKLCNLVSRCLKVLPVKGQSYNIATQRLLLFNTARRTINSCMKILGLKPLSKMSRFYKGHSNLNLMKFSFTK